MRKKGDRTNYALPFYVGIYTEAIEAKLDKMGAGDLDASEIEGWMRATYPTLDNLTRAQFSCEIVHAVAAFKKYGSVRE